jgi:rhodanese-related sulfurtransferase
MKKSMLFLLSLLLLAGCAAPADQESSYRQISMDEAIAIMEDENDYIILDVRTPDEFADKHIPDAINIPNEAIGTEEIPELPDKEHLILVYCRSGNRSKQASEKLAALGYTNIVEFGGIIDWPGETVSDGE